jgi:ABC-2 type transport system ATP-binding protein
MKIELLGVAVGDPETPSLPPTDATLVDGAASIVTVGTERGPMLASLIAAGRLVAERGRVLIDGREDAAALRAAVALVDTPVVAEPADSMPVSTIVREELMFAGLKSSRAAVDAILGELGVDAWRSAPIVDLPPTARIRLLLELAARRPGVEALVLTAPERHGGRTADWVALATEYAKRGIPVLVFAGHAADLDATRIEHGAAHPASAPVLSKEISR